MMSRKRLLIFVLLAVLVCTYCGKDKPKEVITGKPSLKKAEDTFGKNVVLEINEKKFTNDDFKLFLRIHYPDISTPKKEESSNPGDRIISRLFDAFVEHKTILYIANQYDIPIESEELDEYIRKLNVPDNTIDKASVIEAIQVQKFLYSKVYEPIEVTESEIRDYYNANNEEFRKKTEVLLYQILTKDKETALRIRGMLDNNPQRFEEIAQKDSISIEASKGGLMGYFEEGTLPKDMEQVVFSLQPNIISPVVESSYGFHIFKITQKKKGRLLFLDKVRDEIKQKLEAQKLRDAYRDFLVEASHNLAIKINHGELYFKYQNIEGDNGDETKKTTDSGDISDSSD